MKTQRNIQINQQKQKISSFPVKLYLKLYQPNGLVNKLASLPYSYQILDENTLLKKSQNTKEYRMFPFNKVFSVKISNSMMAKHLDFIQDLYQGINHTQIVIVDSKTKKFFTQGSIQHQGLLIQFFNGIFNDCSNDYIKKNIKFYISLFSTYSDKSNNYIDLLNGQRYTFLSKKDIDSYKTFFTKQIQSLQDYLIALKIAMIRYQQCCTQQDFMVFKLTVENQDQFSQKRICSTAKIVICHQNHRNFDKFLSSVLYMASNPQNQSQTSNHGSLFNFVQPYLKNGKISILKCLINSQKQIQNDLQLLSKITAIKNSKSFYKINFQKQSIMNFNIKVNKLINQHQLTIKSQDLDNLAYKQFQKFKSIFYQYKEFMKDIEQKIKSVFDIYKQLFDIREQFYQRQRFSVSLQIKNMPDPTFMIKQYYIAKIYSLSQKFQMQNAQPLCQKLLSMKNRIQIAYKTMISHISKLQNFKENNSSLQNSKSVLNLSSLSSSNIKLKQNQDSKFQNLILSLKKQACKLKNYCRYLLNINQRQINLTKNEVHKKQYTLDSIDIKKIFNDKWILNLQNVLKQYITRQRNKKQQTSPIKEEVQKIIRPLVYKGQQTKQVEQGKLYLMNKSQIQENDYQNKKSQNQSFSKLKKKNKKNIYEVETLQSSLLKVKKAQQQKDFIIRTQLFKYTKYFDLSHSSHFSDQSKQLCLKENKQKGLYNGMQTDKKRNLTQSKQALLKLQKIPIIHSRNNSTDFNLYSINSRGKFSPNKHDNSPQLSKNIGKINKSSILKQNVNIIVSKKDDKKSHKSKFIVSLNRNYQDILRHNNSLLNHSSIKAKNKNQISTIDISYCEQNKRKDYIQQQKDKKIRKKGLKSFHKKQTHVKSNSIIKQNNIISFNQKNQQEKIKIYGQQLNPKPNKDILLPQIFLGKKNMV